MSKSWTQPVSKDYAFIPTENKVFAMIDNYVYLYHTDTLIVIPTFPETIADSMKASFNSTPILSRSAPIYTYANSGPRSFSVTLNLHRDLMNGINAESSNLKLPELMDQDYVETLIKQLQAIALPRYATAQKMVNPPLVAVRFGNDLFCKGVVDGGVTVTYSGPILRTNRYAQVTIDFTISEVDPYDADAVMKMGNFRGLSKTLERRIYRKTTTNSKGFTRI